MLESLSLEAFPCSHCSEPVNLRERGVKEITVNQNVYCDKKCMGKAQTQRATLHLKCSYCRKSFTTLKGRHNDSNLFCSQNCAFAVRKDRYFWTILSVLSEEQRYLSADQIKSRLKERKVDLTPMRIATRIANCNLVDSNRESEPFVYRIKDDFREQPWMWHTSKYYRKIGMGKKEYAAQFE